MMDGVRGVSAVLSSLNRAKNGPNADGQVSAAERGAEMLNPGLVPQLHRAGGFAPWKRIPGSKEETSKEEELHMTLVL